MFGLLWDLGRRLLGILRRGLQILDALARRIRNAVAPADSTSASAQDLVPQETDSASKIPMPPILDNSDEMALARMLASEDRSLDAKAVIGWITVQKQRARKTTMYRLLTMGLGYGPQDRRSIGQPVQYASTAKAPSASDLELARGLLRGTIQPSKQIRAHKPGGWVERGQGVSDERMVQKQAEWNEGIYGRIESTRWFLYSPDSRRLKSTGQQTAKLLLDQVPTIPALDTRPEQAVA